VSKLSKKDLPRLMDKANLTLRERQVIRMRVSSTLEEVGRYFEVTRECIRRIGAKVPRKIRNVVWKRSS